MITPVSSIRKRLYSGEALAAIVLFVFLLWLVARGYPMPHRDDLLFVGAPVHYIMTGQFTNTYCSGFLGQFGTTEYYYYMPLHGYLLRFWLSLCGLSVWSMCAFQWVWYIAGMLAFRRFCIRFLQFSRAQGLWAAALYLCILVQNGLRPDACGFALAITGLCLLQKSRLLHTTAAFIVAGMGCMAAPLAFGLFAPIAVYKMISDKRGRVHIYVLSAIMAMFVCIFLLGMMIHFRYGFFIQTVTAHGRIGNHGFSASYFTRLITEGYQRYIRLPLYLFAWVASVSVLIKGPAHKRAWILTLWAALLFSAVIYTEKTAMFSGVLISWMLVMLCFTAWSSRGLQTAYASLTVVLLAMSQSELWIPLFFQSTRPVNARQARIIAVKSRFIAGDATAARVVFGYRLPDNFRSLDFYQSHFSPDSVAERKQGETWLFSGAFPFPGSLPGGYNLRTVTLMGRSFPSVPHERFRIYHYPE